MLVGQLPFLEAGANLFFERGPRRGQEPGSGIQQAEVAVGFDLVSGPGEEVQFFASARGGHIEDAARLLRFALPIHAIDPGLGLA